MDLHLRPPDLTLAIVVAAAAAFTLGGDPARTAGDPPATIPVTGTLPNPCTGEDVTFSGGVNVVTRARPDGTGGFNIEIESYLSGARGTSESGATQAIRGFVEGERKASPPFPATVPVEGEGHIGSSANDLVARIAFQFTITEEGGVAPTGAAEVISLECRG